MSTQLKVLFSSVVTAPLLALGLAGAANAGPIDGTRVLEAGNEVATVKKASILIDAGIRPIDETLTGAPYSYDPNWPGYSFLIAPTDATENASVTLNVDNIFYTLLVSNGPIRLGYNPDFPIFTALIDNLSSIHVPPDEVIFTAEEAVGGDIIFYRDAVSSGVGACRFDGVLGNELITTRLGSCVNDKNASQTKSTPLPPSLALVMLGLLGLNALRRRKEPPAANDTAPSLATDTPAPAA
ncbi:MAG: hypothetical protein JKP92_09155 [Alphaproteobacteria bacterium]|jgi:hypothetical protein|nr:hypothetical protein [Alphaproteobacteria bacterium]